MSAIVVDRTGGTIAEAQGPDHDESSGPTAYVSVLDLFSIGIDPSSSHTVGPVRAALSFVEHLGATGRLPEVTRISCSLFGSLGATGLGHGTPDAILAGLAGARPETCDPREVRGSWSGLRSGAILTLAGGHRIPVTKTDVSFEPHTRSRTRPRSRWNTTWVSRATRSADWCRCPASNATPLLRRPRVGRPSRPAR